VAEHTALRTVLVDDEPIARRILEEELAEIPGVTIIGRAENGRQAVEVINALHPELVLLDIQMPGCDGFDVVRRLAPLPPAIVFVTAFDQHAIRAFEVGAVDYLLKPVRADRLRAAIEKARHTRHCTSAAGDAIVRTLEASAPTAKRKIVGRRGSDLFLLDLDEILAFRADGELVWILTSHRRYLANQTLHELETRLAETQFRRIHRNALINVDHVRKMSTLSSQRWLITMTNDIELTVSKRQARTIRQVLQT